MSMVSRCPNRYQCGTALWYMRARGAQGARPGHRYTVYPAKCELPLKSSLQSGVAVVMCDVRRVLRGRRASCASGLSQGPHPYGNRDESGARGQTTDEAGAGTVACEPAVDMRLVAAALVANIPPETPVVSYEYATRPWLEELRQSFGSRARAVQQCALDWPRMRVRDERSYGQRVAAYFSSVWRDEHRPSDVHDFFANQAALAKPFGLLLVAHPDLLVTQCAGAPAALLLRKDGTLRLEKAALVWRPAVGDRDPVALFRVHMSVDVGPLAATVAFNPVHL